MPFPSIQQKKKTMLFKWHPDEDPPAIEPHSKAKLAVLRRYLHAYFDKLNITPGKEEFKIDLVDGFAGGGTFQDGGDIISGTPLIMLEESEKAEERLNQDLIKPLKFNSKFYFTDVNKAHTDHLQKVLTERGYQSDDDKVVIRNSPFEEAVDDIIAEIHRRQPRSGRAIFLLDQTGFSQVQFRCVRRIFDNLLNVEVILTFATDALINHLAETPSIMSATAPLELTKEKIRTLIEHRDGVGGKALAQRVLRNHMRDITSVNYDTPFFIRPEQSRRALWFLHLSRHPTARDVMIQQHWDISNTFEHYGPGDFGMLGWDPLQDLGSLPLFNFKEIESQQMQKQLLNSMPNALYKLASENPVTVDTVRHMLANETAARFSDLDNIIIKLFQEKEILILNHDGKPRSSTIKSLKITDRIAFPSQRLFPGISRRRSSD